jgi:16S rRNA (cytosine967-C5)-methyltransferase
MLLEAVAPVAGTRWLDACAGAGGKSLQLAAMLGPDGAVRAEDVRPAALEQLAVRAARCGLSHRIKRAPSPTPSPTPSPPAKPQYDAVLLDAPCTGSGTWRRSPHLRWQLTPERVQAAAALQLQLLNSHAPRVAPGGLLVYATCSQAIAENEAVVSAFLEHAGGDFEPAALPGVGAAGGVPHPNGAHMMVVSPQQHNTDAFFGAALRRRG